MTSEAQLGSSATLCDYILQNQIGKLEPKSVVDFGAGGGKNGRIVRRVNHDCNLIGVDGYEPAAKKLNEGDVYSSAQHLLIGDWFRKAGERHSVAIFGDVIEHLGPREIRNVMRQAVKRFDFIIIIVPLHDIFQDASYGNELEIHKTYVTENFFDRYRITEKHIVHGKEYTIMNVLINNRDVPKPLLKRVMFAGFHYLMLVTQPIGLARPCVNLLKLVLGKKAGELR
jgi:hypothetical protein